MVFVCLVLHHLGSCHKLSQVAFKTEKSITLRVGLKNEKDNSLTMFLSQEFQMIEREKNWMKTLYTIEILDREEGLSPLFLLNKIEFY